MDLNSIGFLNEADKSFEESTFPIKLADGIYQLGRSLLKFQDMRVSRTQLVISVFAESVTVKRTGINLSCITKKNSSQVVQLEQNKDYCLEPGDTIYLLCSLYPIIFASSANYSNISPPIVSSKKRTYSEFEQTQSTKKLLIVDSDDEDVPEVKKPKVIEQTSSKTVLVYKFSTVLLSYLQTPETNPDVIFYNDQVVAINDKYPKAKYHILVMPRITIQNPNHLLPEHLGLVKEMHRIGNLLISQKNLNTTDFKIGFHAIPSMTQLHLHVISCDFDSPSLKTKKHWNSFTSPFFIPVERVEEILTNGEQPQFSKSEYEPLLDIPLRCNRCSENFKTMPLLKSHISQCKR